MARVWRASAADAAAVAELLVEFRDHWGRDWPPGRAFEAGVARLLEDPATEFLLAAGSGGDAAGVCQLRYRHGIWWDGEDCWLEDLYVRPDARRAGLGRALTEAAVGRARARGCARIQLDVAEDNAPARGLYEGLGFGSQTLMLTLPLRERGE